MLTPNVTSERSVSREFLKFNSLIRQVAESDTFRTAPVMRALLIYLWEHQGQSISEYAIATEALGRAPSFDPKSDSTVRVQVARLRAKLKEFMEDAGETFPLRLTLPRGGHELQWVYQPPQKSIASKFDGLPKSYLWAAALAGFALLSLCTGLLVEVRSLKASLPAPVAIPRFWQSFLGSNKVVEVVVPSPLYFFWPTHNVYVRDLKISDFSQWLTSPFLKETGDKWGPPELAQHYVGAMEMAAGVKVLQYLEKEGQQVQLTQSRQFPSESFAAQNTIFLGMPRTAGYLEQVLAKMNFYIASVNPDVIKSRSPKAGEPAEYLEVPYASDRRTEPGIIVLLPQRPEHTRILLLLGRNLVSLASMLGNLEGLKQVDQQWVKAGSPDAWEMVIQAEIYRDTILKTTALACRPIPANFWK
jgi:hypothetical protein